MTSLDFNFAEPIASSDESADESIDTTPADIGSLKKSDFVVLNGRPCKIVEISHSKPGKHGHAKVHLVGIDIFTDRRYESIGPKGHMVQIPNTSKKDYIIDNIDGDNFVTLLDLNKSKVRNRIKLREDADITRRLLDKYKANNGQIRVTVRKVLGEEQIMALKVMD